MDTYREVNEYSTPAIYKLDIQDKLTAEWSWYYISVYMGSVTGMLLSDDDPADFVVVVKFVSNLPYQALGATTECMVESGITSTDRLKPVTCEI